MSTDSHDIAAEASLLGSVMQWPDKVGSSLLMLTEADFYQPSHQALSIVLSDMLRSQQPIDPTTVMSEIQERGLYRQGYLDHSKIYTMYQNAWMPAGAPEYARAIRDHTRKRAATVASIRLGQRIDESGVGIENALDAHLADLAQVPPPLDESLLRQPVTVREMIEQGLLLETYDWIVPGALERGERVVITGTEGGGKSELMAQFACCIAAGVHPFTGMPMPSDQQRRVVIADFENSMRQARRRFKRISEIVDIYPGAQKGWQDRVFFEPMGRSDIMGADRTRFESLIASSSPDVIITGPVYQMGLTDPNSELEAVKFTGVLDKIRLRHNAAILLEAHPGHAQDANGKRLLRPSGSSTWLRWPEIGLGIQRNESDAGRPRPSHVDLVSWRAPREGRAWPRALRNAPVGQLPWAPDDNQYLIDAQSTGEEEF